MATLGLKVRLGGWALIAAAPGCGPQVAIEGSETSGGSSTAAAETSSATTTSTTTSSVTSVSTTASAEVTTAPPPPGTTSTTDDDGSTGSDSSTGGGECSCEGVAVAFDEVIDEGFSAADLLASGTGLELPLVWSAIGGSPSTVVTISLALAPGPIIDEPGGCCGFFMCSPCSEGMTLPVIISVASEDGILAEEVSGTLSGNPDAGLRIESNHLGISEGQGSWTTQEFTNKKEPIDVTELSFDVNRAAVLGSQWIVIRGYGKDVNELLGSTQL